MKRWLAAAVAAWAAVACDQTVEGDDGGPGGDAASALEIIVTYGGAQTPVALGGLATVEVEGSPRIQLSEIVQAGAPGHDPTTLQADDFIAGDGFASSSSPNCEDTLPVAGDLFTQATVDPVTRNLSWPEALAYPGCMAARDLAEVLVSDP